MGKYSFSDTQDERRETRRPKKAIKPVKIKRRTNKGAKEDKLYLELRNKFLSEHIICECCGIEPATDLHHKKGRGVYLLVVQYFLSVCRLCHNRIEVNPEWAIENGYSLLRLNKNND